MSKEGLGELGASRLARDASDVEKIVNAISNQ